MAGIEKEVAEETQEVQGSENDQVCDGGSGLNNRGKELHEVIEESDRDLNSSKCGSF